MTTRTLTHPVAGPVTFDARTFAANIEVTVTDTRHATVTISTPDTSAPSHDAVTDARIEHRPGLLTVEVHDPDAARGITIAHRGNSVSISAVTVGRNVSIVGGHVFMNGAEVTDTFTHQAPVTVRAVLPYGSSIQTAAESGQITATGPLTNAAARTVSGDVRIEHAETATVTTTSGDIEIGRAGSTLTRTVSGDTLIHRAQSANSHAVSGDITILNAAGDAGAHTVSGDIAIRHSGRQTPFAHTVSGRVRVTVVHPSR
jgi:hypothetical protein